MDNHNLLHRKPRMTSSTPMASSISGSTSPTSDAPHGAIAFPHPAIQKGLEAFQELQDMINVQSILAQQSQKSINRSAADWIELKAENSALQTANIKLESENTALQAQINDLLVKVASRDSEITFLRLTNTEQASQIKELTDAITHHVNRTTPQETLDMYPLDHFADSEVSYLKSHITYLEAEIKELTNSTTKLMHRVHVRDERIRGLEDGSHQKDRLIQALQRRLIMNVLRSRDVEITKLRDRHRHHALEIVDLRRRLTHTNEHILRLETNIQNGLTAEGKLQRQLERTQARIIDRMEEFIRGFDELCALERKQVVMNIPELRVQVARMQNDLEEERRKQENGI